ncbi:MAG: helix-turn-helix transcriptional regulator [Clostridia bacterium]|nr:helix-turn-helix transcriptional regulator [Clostridia bacterium]
MEVHKLSELVRNMNSINIEIDEMAYAVIGREWRADNVCSPYTRIYMIVKGSGCISSAGEELKMEAGNIYVVPAGMEFSYRCDEHLEKIYFHINALRPDNYDMFSGLTKFIVLKNREETIRDVNNRINKITAGSILEIKSRVYEIAEISVKTEQKLYEKAFTGYSAVTEGALEYISKNLSAKLAAEEIADAMFVSVSKLQKVFRKEIGVPLRKYINDRLMFAAEAEIRKNELSVKEISESLGFCDQFYFSRCFTEKFGRSPLKYKKLCNM